MSKIYRTNGLCVSAEENQTLADIFLERLAEEKIELKNTLDADLLLEIADDILADFNKMEDAEREAATDEFLAQPDPEMEKHETLKRLQA